MFDIGFSELLLFGIIALIVLGPEKLPQAARTAGQWYSKMRRTVATLQSEIEAELDLAETRQQMQDEIAKIRQTEAEMKREIAAMRGSMQEFEQSQNKGLNTSHQPDATNSQATAHQVADNEKNKPAAFAYGYASQPHQESKDQQELQASNPTNSADTTESSAAIQPMMTKPWENMWFRLGAYDKARRLPAPPRLPNYQADALLHSHLHKTVPPNLTSAPLEKSTLISAMSDSAVDQPPEAITSLNKPEVDS